MLKLSRAVVLFSLLCMIQSAYAQFSGTISGVVVDPTGASVPNASLSLRSSSTNQQRTVKSSAAGVYQFVSLAPGPYELSVTMNGFRGVKVSVTLETNQTLNVP